MEVQLCGEFGRGPPLFSDNLQQETETGKRRRVRECLAITDLGGIGRAMGRVKGCVKSLRAA